MSRAFIINVNGSTQELNHKPTLKEAQEIVGGYIEFVSGKLDNGRNVTLVMDDAGQLKGKAVNLKATVAYQTKYPSTRDIIVGDVIVLEGWRTVG